ncbi:MFS general substrate transporter [Chloropicon primus]|uniref:MFS general substrate transporter n=1 Tax=Chloropicon primus TaxID=1764295 RepID=A0A5B8MYN9_9CHLO|nr:MFS general substrate transporter [Chloropicon primus]UPR03723.1 MFS general substrate transporter [Chloropicon primus]|eukprot:QDZ24514.1 MFS general substrate transporter [Chloropicon primus]
MYFSKTTTFAWGSFLQIFGGQTYSFSDYSQALQTGILQLTDTKLQGLQTALTAGSYFGLPAGLVYDRVKHWPRAGPRGIIAIGCIFNFVGYFCFWSVATGRFTGIPYWMICAFAFVAGSGTTWLDTTVMATNVGNLKEESGIVIGALKSFVGLGAGMSTQFFKAYFTDRPLSFLLMQGIAPTLVATVTGIFTNIVPYVETSQSYARRACKVAVMTGLVIVVLIFMSTFIKTLNKGEGKIIWVWLILGTFVPLLASPLYTGGIRSIRVGSDEDEEDDLLQRLTDPTDQNKGGEASEEDGLTFGETLRRLDFWLLWFVFGNICGCGLTLLHNLGQIVPAFTDGKKTECTIYVQLFSLMNCCGRLGAGYLSQHMLSKYRVPRTLFLMVPGLMLGFDFILLNFISFDKLYIPVLIGGLAFGTVWSLIPSILCDRPFFGTKAFASNYNMTTLSSVFGDFLLSTQLSGRFYDYQRKKQHHASAECYGRVCFRQTFMVVSGIAFLSCFAALALFLRSRKKYKQM